MRSGIHLVLAMLVTAALALPAWAIELEPIQVRSRMGDPLLAEIRLRDVPANAGQLSARLPDPVVFARIGLPRPRGAVSDLRFEVRRPEGGAPMIRVTTMQPINEDFLTFLVQVEWSEGSLVREFSVALTTDAPPALPTTATPERPPAAPSMPAEPLDFPDPAAVDASRVEPIATRPAAFEADVETPEASPIPVIARGLRLATENPPAETQAIPVVPRASTPSTPDPASAPSPTAAAPIPLASSASTSSAPDIEAGQTIAVRRGSHLTGIARASAPDGIPIDVAMVAFLIANPDAFADGNINRLQQGATLRVPSAEMMAAIDPAGARALVSLQEMDWQGSGIQREAMASLLSKIEAGLAPAPVARAAAVATAPARMQIVPVGDPSSRDSTHAPTHIEQGTALQEEMAASRDVEIRHLQQKIVDLERESEAQRALIAMQNEALAQAQRHLRPGTGMPGMVRSPWTWLTLIVVIGLALFARRSHRRGSPRVRH